MVAIPGPAGRFKDCWLLARHASVARRTPLPLCNAPFPPVPTTRSTRGAPCRATRGGAAPRQQPTPAVRKCGSPTQCLLP